MAKFVRRVCMFMAFVVAPGLSMAEDPGAGAAHVAPDPSTILVTLILCGLLGLVGQAARPIVGMKTLVDSAHKQGVSSGDLFSLSRLIFSLIVGFAAGVLTLLVQWVNSFGQVAVSGFSAAMTFVVAGYIGTDVIEAFTTKFFDKDPASGADRTQGAEAGTGPKAPSPNEQIEKKVSDLSEKVDDVHATLVAFAAQPRGSVPGTTYPAWALARDMKLAEANYWDAISEAATTYNLPVPVIVAIGSKESQWGLALKPQGPTGTGDWSRRDPAKWGVAMPDDGKGWGRGLMQIDWHSHDFAKTGDWQDPHANIMYGCSLLADLVARESRKGSDPNTALRCAVSAYNGMSGAYSAYCTDVMARADWIAQIGLGRAEAA